MKFWNIHVFEDKKDKSIKIRIDEMDCYERNKRSHLPENLNNIKKGINIPAQYEIIEDIYKCSNEKIFLSALSPCESSETILNTTIQSRKILGQGQNKEDAPLNPGGFQKLIINQEKVKQYKHSTVTYTLSTIPYIALYQFWCLASHVITLKPPTVYFNAQLSEQLQGNGEQNLFELSAKFDKENNASGKITIPYLMQGILQHNEVKPYEHSMEALKKMLDCYTKNLAHNGKFIDCLEVEKRCMNLYTELTQTFLEPEIYISNKINIILNQARNFIHEDQKHELNFQINSIHALPKKKLIAPCLGKESHEGFTKNTKATYTANYTELSFIEHAELFLRADKRMSIINIKTNKEYLKTYAEGKRNHGGLLKDELLYLGFIIGLEIDQDSDFENEIIFTLKCTKKLQEMGLHLTLNYIKSLLHAQNQSAFFAKSANSTKGTNVFTPLPADIYPTIVNQLQPLDEEEISYCIKSFLRY